MYVDYRLGLGLKITTKELNLSFLNILDEVSSTSSLLKNNIFYDYNNIGDVFEELGFDYEKLYITTKRRDDLPRINIYYQGDYFLCVKKVSSDISSYAANCTEEDLKSFEKEKTLLKAICLKIGIEYIEENTSILIDSNDY